MNFIYGMRLRGFAPGCQPKDCNGKFSRPVEKYHDILCYPRELAEEELDDYELDFLAKIDDEMLAMFEFERW